MTTGASAQSRFRRLLLPLALVLLGTLVTGCGDDNSTAADEASAGTPAITGKESTVKRTSVNPWQWSIELGFNQAELVQGGDEVLYLAGQSSMDANGSPQHAGDMAAQVSLALDNLEAVLAAADMDLSNVVRLNTYTTDVDVMFANYGLVAERLGAAGVQPPGSLLGVSRLAYPELMVEFEATAVR